uniref:TPA: orf y n=1 Tax=Tanacetum cinerariifolium TaxID=118510 RepID=A0A6L2KJ89_TANCI|nr:TPA: orf y [Tanacetum cinerariifolium]
MVQEQEILESSESEWENPFATKHSENQENYCFHLNEEDEELPYPKFKKEVERNLANEVAYPADEASSSGIYNPPKDSMMGPPVYPPSTGIYQQNDGQSWSNNKSKLLYIENLLGEQEKLMLQQWRTTYSEVYETLIGMADDPQNITSHVRTVIIMEDPYKGSTEEPLWSRLHCPTCCLTACANCANYYLKIKMIIKNMEPEVKNTQSIGTSGDGTIIGMIKAKDDEIKQMIKDRAKEYYENIQKEKGWEQELADEKRKVSQLEEKIKKYEKERFEREFPPLGGNPSMLVAQEELIVEPQIKNHVAGVVLETEVIKNAAEDQEETKPKVRKVKVRNAKVFSKFDLKSGFHQVAMEEGSIPWTAFLAPGGLYGWLIMPFGLKNAQTVFQRKMDKCFKGTEAFIAIYIDDILVFSKNEEEHAKHLDRMLQIYRQHIPKLGILLRPLYEKTNAHGDKRLKPSDYQLIREIKTKVQQLPDLLIPPEEAHIILEIDGCIEGWGGVVKWKPKKKDSRNVEKVCAYASGKITNIQSTIDAEISACINTLEKLKIYYLDKQEITLRTDCQEIISFYKKTSSSKASRGNKRESKEKPIHTQLMLIQHVPSKELQDPWNPPPLKMPSQHSLKSMKSCDTKHKYAVEKDQETTTSKMYGQKYLPKPSKKEDYYKKPKNSLTYNDTQSEESEEDSIVDPGWDDFCLTSAKLLRMKAHRLSKETRYCRI